jgi:hypothetical protein
MLNAIDYEISVLLQVNWTAGNVEVSLPDDVLRGEVLVAEERSMQNQLRFGQAPHREVVLYDDSHSRGLFFHVLHYTHHEKYFSWQRGGFRFLS